MFSALRNHGYVTFHIKIHVYALLYLFLRRADHMEWASPVNRDKDFDPGSPE